MKKQKKQTILTIILVIAIIALVVLKVFTREEYKMLPAGDKIVKILEKMKIY